MSTTDALFDADYNTKYNFDSYLKLIGSSQNQEQKEETTVTIHPKDQTVEIYKPKLTRNTLSIYEFVRVITAVAKHLSSIRDISAYISDSNDIEINSIINPAELAFKLVKEGKINATLERLGYEKVTFSELKINPLWINTLEDYFATRRDAEVNELLRPLGLVD